MTDQDFINYALRYGGMCRDCADTRVRGICDTSGMPCDSSVCEKVIRHALGAWRYGIKHGFIDNPLAHPDTLTDEAKLRRSQALDELGALDGELI